MPTNFPEIHKQHRIYLNVIVIFAVNNIFTCEDINIVNINVNNTPRHIDQDATGNIPNTNLKF